MSKVTIVRRKAENHEVADDLALIDMRELVVTVSGLGTTGYRWRVDRGEEYPGGPEYSPMASLEGAFGAPGEDGMYGIAEMGRAAVYFEEITFGYAVYNTVLNQ